VLPVRASDGKKEARKRRRALVTRRMLPELSDTANSEV